MKVIYDREKDRGSDRVVRGGSWFSDAPQNCRAAFRVIVVPGLRRNPLGFRPLIRIKGRGLG